MGMGIGCCWSSLVVAGHTQQKQSHKHQQGQEKKAGGRDHVDGKAGEASLVDGSVGQLI